MRRDKKKGYCKKKKKNDVVGATRVVWGVCLGWVDQGGETRSHLYMKGLILLPKYEFIV